MKNNYLLALLLLLIVAGIAWLSFSIERNLTIVDEYWGDYLNAGSKFKRAVFEDYIDKIKPQVMLAKIEEEIPLCHSEAHDLGKVIFAQTSNVHEAIETCRNGCGSGCFHGTLMEIFKDVVIPENEIDYEHEHEETEADDHLHVTLSDIEEKVDEICNDEDVKKIEKQASCVHGMGHAFEFLNAYKIERALKHCEIFDDRRLEYYCASGVFMERDLEFGRFDIKTKSSHYPCDEFTEFPTACYRYKAYEFGKIYNDQQFADECLKLDRLERQGCFSGFGLYHVNDVRQNPERITHICKYGDLNDRRMCIEGLIEILAAHNEPEALTACSVVEEELQEVCNLAAYNKYYSLDKDYSLYFEQ